MNKISEQVQNSVNEAIGNMRNALSFASRTESPSTIVFLGKILQDLEDVIVVDQRAEAIKKIQQHFLNLQDGDKPPSF